MASIDIIRAWKDLEYRNSLTEEQRALLPANPAGLVELTEEELEEVAGGVPPLSGTVRINLCCA